MIYRRKKLNQLKEQFAQLKSQKKSVRKNVWVKERGGIQVETGPTDEDVKTADVKRDDNPKLEETVGQRPITVVTVTNLRLHLR